jgi:hypothetical protein
MEWFKPEYRIVQDEHGVYEAQSRRWWWPFWCYVPLTLSLSVEEAEGRLIAQLRVDARRARTVKYLGRLQGDV